MRNKLIRLVVIGAVVVVVSLVVSGFALAQEGGDGGVVSTIVGFVTGESSGKLDIFNMRPGPEINPNRADKILEGVNRSGPRTEQVGVPVGPEAGTESTVGGESTGP